MIENFKPFLNKRNVVITYISNSKVVSRLDAATETGKAV